MKQQYKCVNCSQPVDALYKTYGPSVLKLTKCPKCKGIVDKYIEYDPVIVAIDLVLMSREAQKHILYNTEFKSYWKLLIILIMLETYGVWRRDSLFNIAINSMCGIPNNTTVNMTNLNITMDNLLPESWKNNCWAWTQIEKADETDLFIWEKDFYIQFLATFAGIVAFILTVNGLMQVARVFHKLNEVSARAALRGFSLGDVGGALALPTLVWGAEAAGTRAAHCLLVAAYAATMLAAVHAVLYKCPMTTTVIIIVIAYCAKYATYFHVTPYLAEFIS